MSLQRLLESQIVLIDFFFLFLLQGVLIAYKTWWRHKTSGYFQRAHGGERDLEGKWCYQRYLQKKETVPGKTQGIGILVVRVFRR